MGIDRDELVVICTRNRAQHVRELLTLLAEQAVDLPILLVDSSDDDSLKAESASRFGVIYHHTDQRSLARQRNIALDYADIWSTRIVHFLDDDSRPCLGYFDAIRSELKAPMMAGAGGTIINQEIPRFVWVKRFFWLYGREPGAVLRSGRNTIGHYPHSGGGKVQWLPGCAMSYRVDRLVGERFDDRLEGYSWGEDMDFSFRVGRHQHLVISAVARMRHLEAPENRLKAGGLARDRTRLLHRWVREHRADGMSLGLYWWSVFGEILLRTVESVLSRDGETSRAIARGVAAGAWQELRRR